MSSTFHPFPRLPTEIRLQIWKDAVEIRILEVHWCSDESYTFHHYPPSLLSVCHESRAISRPYYRDEEISMTTRNGHQKAFFSFERDILYFPYRFQCSHTYGLLLETFLRKLKPEYVDKLGHLALCLPLQDPGSEATAETLNEHTNFNAAGDFGRDSMTFFSNVQALARRPGDLLLRSITLVFNDPIMEEIPSIERNIGVARVFKVIDIEDESSRELWTSRIDYCKWKLTQPHEPRDNLYTQAQQSMPNGIWGGPDFVVRMMATDRRYVGECDTHEINATLSNSGSPDRLVHPKLILWTGPTDQVPREFYPWWERHARFLVKEGVGLSRVEK